MPDDKKFTPYKDYGDPRRKTGPVETPLVIEATKPGRHDPTPPPVPGSITNEDLAVKIKDVDKKQDEFQVVTTQRLTSVENKVGSIDLKVDKVTTLLIDQAAQKQTFTMDVMSKHLQVSTEEKLAEVEVGKTHAVAEIEDVKDSHHYRRRLILRVMAIVGTITGVLATLATLAIEHC